MKRSKPLTANREHDWEDRGEGEYRCSRCWERIYVPPDADLPDWKNCPGKLGRPSELESSSGLSPVSDTNSGREHQRDEGLREYVRHLPCCACGKEPPSDPHHVRNWGAGWGDWLPDGCGNLAPLCRMCHGALDDVGGGKQSFEDYWSIDLAAEAERIGRRYEDGGE